MGQEVMESLTPAQQVVKIVNEELTKLMGGEEPQTLHIKNKGQTAGPKPFGQILPGWKSLSARCACAILGCLNRIPAFSGLPRRC